MNPDIAKLAAYAGVYEKQLFSTLFNALDVADDVTVIPDVKHKFQLTKLKVKKGIRPYSSIFEPVDDQEYTGREADAELFKKDIQVAPLKYKPTWMGEMTKPGTDPQDMPFAKYVWNEEMKSVANEINDDTAYLGVRNPAGKTGADITDGYGTIIAKEIAAGKLAPVVLGDFAEADAVEKFETLMKSMQAAYRKAGFFIYCSFDQSDKYNNNYRSLYKKYTEQNADGAFIIDNTQRRVIIKPVTWMGNSKRLIAAPKENMLMLTDRLSDLNTIHAVPMVHTVDAGIIGKIGFQVRDLDAMRVSDIA